MSALTWNAGHTAASATFTATDGSTTAATVTVDAGYTDVAGNLGSSGTDTAPVDTANPTAAVDITDIGSASCRESAKVTVDVGRHVHTTDERHWHSGFCRYDVGPDLGRRAYGSKRDLHGDRRQHHGGHGHG